MTYWGGVGVAHSYIGYNVIGGTQETPGGGVIAVKQVVLASPGFLAAISAYIQNPNADTVIAVRAGVFTDSAGQPDVVMAMSEPAPAAGTNFLGEDGPAGVGPWPSRWLHLPIGIYLPAGTYWIGFGAAGSNGPIMVYDAGGSDRFLGTAIGWLADVGRYTNVAKSRTYSIRASLLQ